MDKKAIVFTVLFALAYGWSFAQSCQIKLEVDTANFDLGHISYGQAMKDKVTILWRIKNTTKYVINSPNKIDVWNDCGIAPIHTSMEPLIPGRQRYVQVKVHTGGRIGYFTKSGYVTTACENHEHKYPISITCFIDTSLPKNQASLVH